jgi:hypothetical protein
MKKGQNTNRPAKGSQIKVLPITKLKDINPTTQHNVQHLPSPVAFSCETNKNGDYAAGSTLLIQ